MDDCDGRSYNNISITNTDAAVHREAGKREMSESLGIWYNICILFAHIATPQTQQLHKRDDQFTKQ